MSQDEITIYSFYCPCSKGTIQIQHISPKSRWGRTEIEIYVKCDGCAEVYNFQYGNPKLNYIRLILKKDERILRNIQKKYNEVKQKLLTEAYNVFKSEWESRFKDCRRKNENTYFKNKIETKLKKAGFPVYARTIETALNYKLEKMFYKNQFKTYTYNGFQSYIQELKELAFLIRKYEGKYQNFELIKKEETVYNY